MRALTVRQPWAWAILHGGKDVENRTQAWRYRGPLLIHAGSGWSERGAASPLIHDALAGVAYEGEDPADLAQRQRHHFGKVLGVVELVDIHAAAANCCSSPWAETTYQEAGGRQRHDLVHLVLEQPRALADPVPATGRLGLWTPDRLVQAAVESQLDVT